MKGIIRCAYCLMPMWSQTYKSSQRHYREQARSRSHIECPAEGKSIRCEIPDEQMGRIISALVSDGLFQQVQSAMKRNSGRSETLHPRPERESLLKGLVKCAHCGMVLWAQTLKSGSRLYREQARSRSHIECPADGKSIRCEIPDEQMGWIISAIELGPMWQQQVMAIISVKDEVERVKHQSTQAEQRLKWLGKAFVAGLYSDDDHRWEKRGLGEKLAGLVAPEVDATREAGKLLEELPNLWGRADLGEGGK